MNPWFVAIPIAYLLGSIPFGYLLVKLVRKQDIRETGSGNIGATNVIRSGAKWLGILTLLLDLGKAFAAVKLAQSLAPGDWNLSIMAAVATILGHVFPVWLGFRGGKGVASALGLMLALDWRAGACVFAVFLAVLLASHFVSLGSIVGAASFPFLLLYFVPSRTPVVVSGAIFMALLVIVKHHQNIGRLLAGTESRFGSGRRKDEK